MQGEQEVDVGVAQYPTVQPVQAVAPAAEYDEGEHPVQAAEDV